MRIRTPLGRMLRGLARRGGFDIVRDEIGHDAFRDFGRLLGPSVDVIFDVGANVGQTAVELASRFPAASILSFEPDPETFAQLERATVPLKNVRPYQFALGEAESTEPLYLARHCTGNSLLPVAPETAELHLGAWSEQRGRTEVTVKRLDHFCRTQEIERIDLLKTDTQGAELMVLRGAGEMLNQASIRAIFCEVCFIAFYAGQPKFDDIYAVLTGRGYRLVDFYNRVRTGGRELAWADALFV